MTSSQTVLVVEDERDLADLFSLWLAEEYTVVTAYDGNEALAALDSSLDCILLDRRMPGLSGDEVLEEARKAGIDCPIAMVTAVEPDYDVIEMGFDNYIVKPLTKQELFDLVKNLLTVSSYDDQLQAYFQLASKKGALEASKTKAELNMSSEYSQLVAEFEDLQDNVNAQRNEVSDPFSLLK